MDLLPSDLKANPVKQIFSNCNRSLWLVFVKIYRQNIQTLRQNFKNMNDLTGQKLFLSVVTPKEAIVKMTNHGQFITLSSSSSNC